MYDSALRMILDSFKSAWRLHKDLRLNDECSRKLRLQLLALQLEPESCLDLYEDSEQDDDGCVGDPHVQEPPSPAPAPSPALTRLRLGPRARTGEVQIMIGVNTGVIGTQVNLTIL